jgi:ATP-dependent HslUV protease subunit HslV
MFRANRLFNFRKFPLTYCPKRQASNTDWHGTTILCVRKDGVTFMAGDGQVSMGYSVVKGNAKKVRKLHDNILVGFAGSTADAMTLLDRLEKKLEEHPGQLLRSCVELAKAWRTDKFLRRLEVRKLKRTDKTLS